MNSALSTFKVLTLGMLATVVATAIPAAATAVATAAAAATTAAAACQSYTKLESAVAPSPASAAVLSSIVVPDTFKVGTVAVSDVELSHGRVGALKVRGGGVG